MTPELSAQIQVWRQKVRDKTITQSELRDALAALRQGRASSAVTSAGSRAKKAPVNSDDLLNQLEGL